MADADLEKVLERVNRLLGIDAAVTVRGDEVKAYTPDDDGGRSKAYLSSLDCWTLSNAFAYLGMVTAQASSQRSSDPGSKP